jgi:hypothetical protein
LGYALGGKAFPRRAKTVLICIAQIVGGIKVICKAGIMLNKRNK